MIKVIPIMKDEVSIYVRSFLGGLLGNYMIVLI
jgi:hypothetical protein